MRVSIPVFRRCPPLGLAVAVLLALPAPALAISEDSLRSSLSASMRQAGAASSAYVMRLDDDARVFSLRADRPLIPASVNKLFVTATALRLMGPGERLTTSVLTTGEIDESGVLKGNLYVRGSGDPSLTSDRIAALAAELQAQGLTRVTGKVLGDESVFDQLRGSANTGGRLDSEIGGQLGGLVADRGYASGGWQKRPAAVAADALLTALEKAKIPVKGKAGLGVAPEDATELATTSSAPVSTLIKLTNVPSDNFYAEQLLKIVGARFGDSGTTDAGARVVSDELAPLAVKPTVVDGSGLSRSDRTTARMAVTLIDTMAEGDQGATFVDSLAVAGRSGTLLYRMRSGAATGRCMGKTGTLRDVSNLAGICTTAGGEKVGFAILMNSVNPTSARAIQDRMVEAIAQLR